MSAGTRVLAPADLGTPTSRSAKEGTREYAGSTVKALGYIRTSGAKGDNATSPETQRDAILALAAQDGIAPHEVAIFEDIGRSGGEGKERLRAGYQQMLDALSNEPVTGLYALTLTRLARSNKELWRVAGICAQRNVRLIFQKEGRDLDPTTRNGKLMFGLLSLLAEFERDLASERSRDNVAKRRERLALGDPNVKPFGLDPYGAKEGEDVAAVVEAFRTAGSFLGACRILNERKVPTRRAGAWIPSSVRKLIEREIPDELPAKRKRGVGTLSVKRYQGLLRDASGHRLVVGPAKTRRGNPTEQRYVCEKARLSASSDRRWVAARHAIDNHARNEAIRADRAAGLTYKQLTKKYGLSNWGIQYALGQRLGGHVAMTYQEALTVAPPAEGVISVSEPTITAFLREPLRAYLQSFTLDIAARDAARAELAVQKDRLTQAYVRGRISDEMYESEVSRIEGDEAQIGLSEQYAGAKDVDYIDLDGPPAKVNNLLSVFIDYIELNEKMRPVRIKFKEAAE